MAELAVAEVSLPIVILAVLDPPAVPAMERDPFAVRNWTMPVPLP